MYGLVGKAPEAEYCEFTASLVRYTSNTKSLHGCDMTVMQQLDLVLYSTQEARLF